jgi:hypothetical protein
VAISWLAKCLKCRGLRRAFMLAQATPRLRALASHEISISGPVAQYPELAADNRLVGSSSPPRPRWRLITAWLEVRVLPAPPRSLANRDFPVPYEKPGIGGHSRAYLVSADNRLNETGRIDSTAVQPCRARDERRMWLRKAVFVKEVALLERYRASCVQGIILIRMNGR